MNSISTFQSSDRIRTSVILSKIFEEIFVFSIEFESSIFFESSSKFLSTLLATRSFSSIYSIALILQSESCTKVTVISSQEIFIFRFNTSSTHQHRSYSLCSRVNSKVYLSISTYRSFSFVSMIFSVSSQKVNIISSLETLFFTRIQYSLCFDTEIIYLFREHCEIISVLHQQEFRLSRFRDESNISFSVSTSKIVQIFISI